MCPLPLSKFDLRSAESEESLFSDTLGDKKLQVNTSKFSNEIIELLFSDINDESMYDQILIFPIIIMRLSS